MPIESLSRVMSRIKTATPAEPISVFIVTVDNVRKLDAVYANTVDAKRRQVELKPYHPSDKCKECGHIEYKYAHEWVGDYHNHNNMPLVKEALKKSLEN